MTFLFHSVQCSIHARAVLCIPLRYIANHVLQYKGVRGVGKSLRIPDHFVVMTIFRFPVPL